MSNDEFALYDAAYVLGALSPAERREFETHLLVCADCAGSVARLAGLPGLMSRVSLEQLTAEAEPLPETLLPSLARSVRHERRRRRLAIGATAAAAACLIAVGAVSITRSDSPTVRPPVAVPASSPASTGSLALTAVAASPITATARLVDMAWGTRIDLTCVYRTEATYPGDSIPFALVVIDRHGSAQQVATWKALPGRELTVSGTSSRARRDIAAVEVRTLSGKVILRLRT
jgi:hypothetical protein